MDKITFAAALVCSGLLAGSAYCADSEAGVPLSPGEAAGAWTLESHGHNLCGLDLGAHHSVTMGTDCATVMRARPTAWSPTPDGMKLVSADGQTTINFHRWSNSLFVAHRPDGDLQLRRGR